MAYGKDYWAIDPGLLRKSVLTAAKPPVYSYDSLTSPRFDAGPAVADVKSPGLTEALDKPLYKFTEGELHELVKELEAMRWLDKERQVARITHEFMLAYRSHGDPSTAFQRNVKAVTLELPVQGFNIVPRPASATVPVSSTSSYHSIRISIPVSIPPDYVYAFVERMVREYFEEG